MPPTDRTEPVSRAFGETLRNLRRSRGYAQRDLLRPLHLSSHTAIVDYEAGRRIPPEAIISAYEGFFELPAGSLRKLRQQALAERAAAEVRAWRGAAGLTDQPGRLTPRQLPGLPPTFVGRAAELAQLDRLLRDQDVARPVVISAVSGMGGIGKTALAVHWAHHARDNFRDGELYIDMQGYHPSGRPVAAETAICQFLVALGVTADRMPVVIAEQAALYRALMADRQMLVLIDNVRDVDQVRPLLPGSSACRVLVTSRSRLPGLAARDGAQRVYLDCFAMRDAVSLLRELIGTKAVKEPGATAALARLCGLHPLALSIAAERVMLGRSSVGDAVAALSQAQNRLEDLAVAEDDQATIRKVFTWSYDGLGKREQRLFQLLGLHDGPDITARACAALAGLDERACEDGLANLTEAHLVDASEGRYRMHDLVRLFAKNCLDEHEPVARRQDAAFRLAAWYLASTCAARTALDPNLPPLDPVRSDLPVPVMTFDTEAAALGWCDAERHNLVATSLFASKERLYEIAWKLPTAIFPFFDRCRHFGDWITTHQSAATAANLVGDQEAEGKVRCNLGSAFRLMLRFDDAVQQYERALELFRLCGWRQGVGKVLGNLANAHHASGNNEQAIAVGMQARALFGELGDKYGEALSLSNLGNAYSSAGQYDRAMETLRQALAAFESIGDRRGVARAEGNIGQALGRMGRHEEAIQVLLAAIRTFEEIADPHEQAYNLADLAGSYLALGQREKALATARQAADIHASLGEDWLVAALRERFPGLAPPFSAS